MQEIIFEKSRRNLKAIFDHLSGNTVGSRINQSGIFFCAIGGYNRTYELIQALGVSSDKIAMFSNLTLTETFLSETHLRKVLLIKKLNYVTGVKKNEEFSRKYVDLNISDAFEESMMIYQHANRKFGTGKNKTDWVKPTVVILDDPSLNLQHSGHRFHYQRNIGFVQMRNRNVDPYRILFEIKDVEPAEHMMFAAYQNKGADEAEILDAINRIRMNVNRFRENEWFMKPTEFKRAVGNLDLVNALKEIPELGIHQLKNNKKIGKENARWMVIPAHALEFKGFKYQEEQEQFEESLAIEEQYEEKQAQENEKLLTKILFEEFTINFIQGYVGAKMGRTDNATLQSFVSEIDDVEETTGAIQLLSSATSDIEYKNIKKNHLVYFLDGNYNNDERNDQNYIGGKRLISIDVDDGDYTRKEIESKLENQSLFGIVYPTAKYYFDESKRWRIILLADDEMSKDDYKATVEGVSRMLDLEIDEASKKISQLMGYPLSNKDVSTVIGTMVNVSQFRKKNLISFNGESNKKLMDFNHSQARLLKQAIESGIAEGRRNDTYRQIIMYLRDTLNNPDMAKWHQEALELELVVRNQMAKDGLEEREIEVICR